MKETFCFFSKANSYTSHPNPEYVISDYKVLSLLTLSLILKNNPKDNSILFSNVISITN